MAEKFRKALPKAPPEVIEKFETISGAKDIIKAIDNAKKSKAKRKAKKERLFSERVAKVLGNPNDIESSAGQLVWIRQGMLNNPEGAFTALIRTEDLDGSEQNREEAMAVNREALGFLYEYWGVDPSKAEFHRSHTGWGSSKRDDVFYPTDSGFAFVETSYYKAGDDPDTTEIPARFEAFAVSWVNGQPQGGTYYKPPTQK